MSSVVVISQYFGVVLAAAIGVFTGLGGGGYGGDWASILHRYQRIVCSMVGNHQNQFKH